MESSWLDTKIASVPKTSTGVLVLDKLWVKENGLSLKKTLFANDNFLADLNFEGFGWFYHATEKIRCLLILHEVKEDDLNSQRKAMVELAKKAVAQLQTKKIMEVDFIFDSNIKNLQ